MHLTKCDFCDEQYDYADRGVVALRRPSDPSDLCSVMAGCPACIEEHGLYTPEEIEVALDRVETEGADATTVLEGLDLSGVVFLTL